MEFLESSSSSSFLLPSSLLSHLHVLLALLVLVVLVLVLLLLLPVVFFFSSFRNWNKESCCVRFDPSGLPENELFRPLISSALSLARSLLLPHFRFEVAVISS